MSSINNIKSKKKLSKLLFISYPNEFNHIKNIYSNTPEKCFIRFIQDGRELFKLLPNAKKLHKRLYLLMSKEVLPDYIKSGRKKHSYLTNAFEHKDANNFFFIDIKNFYPSITFDKIKRNLILNYKQSADVATFISNLITVKQNKSNGMRALVTGSPLSQSFSFLINKPMFDKLHILANEHNITMSVYVDDISFSTKATIPFKFISNVHSILKSHGYDLSKGKGKYYRGREGKNAEVTGVKITKYGFFITDKRKDKIRKKVQLLQKNHDIKLFESLMSSILQAKLLNDKYVKYERYLKNKLFSNKLIK